MLQKQEERMELNMELNEALNEGLDVDFNDARTVVSANETSSNLVLDMPEEKKNTVVFEAMLQLGILKPGSVISFIPGLGKTSPSEKIVVRQGEDVYYVGMSRGSFQFYVITYSKVDFYLFL